jgi:hypothetical protein
MPVLSPTKQISTGPGVGWGVERRARPSIS